MLFAYKLANLGLLFFPIGPIREGLQINAKI